MSAPPENNVPIVHAIRILHKDFYTIGKKLPKADKLGIHSIVESRILKCLALAVEATFTSSETKFLPLQKLQMRISVVKNLIRTENELAVIDDKTYLRLSAQLVEISKMANGWLTYATQKGR